MVINANDCVAFTINTTAPTSASDSNIIDFVGFGSASVFEGTAAPNLTGGTNACIARSSTGADTNVNGDDFTVRDGSCTPKATNP